MGEIVSIQTNLMRLSIANINSKSTSARLPRIPRAGRAIRGFEASAIRACVVGCVGGDTQLHIIGQIGGRVGNYVTF